MNLSTSDGWNVFSSFGVNPLTKFIYGFVDCVVSLFNFFGLFLPVILTELSLKFVLPPGFEIALFFLQNFNKFLGVRFNEGIPRLTLVIRGIILAFGDLPLDRVDELRYCSFWIDHLGRIGSDRFVQQVA